MPLERMVREILDQYEKAWSFDSRDLERPSADEVLHRLIAEAPEDDRPRLEAEFFGCGPLRELLQDESIQEIVINGADLIWFERLRSFSGAQRPLFERHPHLKISQSDYVQKRRSKSIWRTLSLTAAGAISVCTWVAHLSLIALITSLCGAFLKIRGGWISCLQPAGASPSSCKPYAA